MKQLGTVWYRQVRFGKFWYWLVQLIAYYMMVGFPGFLVISPNFLAFVVRQSFNLLVFPGFYSENVIWCFLQIFSCFRKVK